MEVVVVAEPREAVFLPESYHVHSCTVSPDEPRHLLIVLVELSYLLYTPGQLGVSVAYFYLC